MKFKISSQYSPTGDQPQAIDQLVQGVSQGRQAQTLLGVTGSGKTFTMANVIERLQRPTLILSHNKTLAAQLYSEFKQFFPDNAVQYFVSYYDYYQPEAYIPSVDKYIEKDLMINDEIDRLRLATTSALLSGRRDVVVVSSVSCIYGMGNPEDFNENVVTIRSGQKITRNEFLRKLVAALYSRNEMDFQRGNFRVKGDTVDIRLAYEDIIVRVVFWGDEVEKVITIHPDDNAHLGTHDSFNIFPANLFVTSPQRQAAAIAQIQLDLGRQIEHFSKEARLLEAQRIEERVNYDVEMIREVGFCSGIENYSRYFDGREIGQAPYTLLDFFPKDFITFIDESHMTIPQIHGMYNGDRARKNNLVEYGFRLPSAYDNRPLTFEEFDARLRQVVCMSATPAKYELDRADDIAEQIIRPTGLLDPEITVKPVQGQIDDLLGEINGVVGQKGRVLITTLTKKMAENLTDYLKEMGVRVKYMHSDIDTLERIEIVRGLREGEFDVLVGINLLREGLDIPEVQLVAILDADKEGFLSSESALIQTIGRAARNDRGRVVMYADNMTDSMKRAIGETNRRRKIQDEYNKAHGITPRTVVSAIKNSLEITKKAVKNDKLTVKDLAREIERVKGLMKVASEQLDFEKAIVLRDELNELKRQMKKLS